MWIASRESPCLQLPHPTWALICVPAAKLLIHLLVNALGNIVEDGTSVWAPATMSETQMKFLAPGFVLAQPLVF